MKTFLLTAALSVMTLAASAQVMISDLSKNVEKGPIKNAPKMIFSNESPKKFDLTKSAPVQKMRKVSAEENVESLYGNYVWYDQKSQEEGGVDGCNPAKISAADDYIYENSETGEKTTYKQVLMEGLAGGYATATAYLLADTLVIESPEGVYCYEHSTYGKMSLHGLYVGIGEDGSDALMISNSLVFYKNEDGNLQLYPGYIGWIVYMDDYAAAGNESPYWNLYYNQTGEGVGNMLKTNGIQAYQTVKNNDWVKVESEVYVKKARNSISIYNFIDQSVASMSLKSDGSAVLPMGQPMYSLQGAGVDTDTYGNTMDLVGIAVTDDGYIRHDYTKTEITGEWSGNTLVQFYSTEANPADGYYSIASKADAEGAAYGLGWYYGYELLFGEDYTNYINGIEDVKVQAPKTSNKTFNMMGQQVGANAKGIIIKNGKKFLVK